MYRSPRFSCSAEAARFTVAAFRLTSTGLAPYSASFTFPPSAAAVDVPEWFSSARTRLSARGRDAENVTGLTTAVRRPPLCRGRYSVASAVYSSAASPMGAT